MNSCFKKLEGTQLWNKFKKIKMKKMWNDKEITSTA